MTYAWLARQLSLDLVIRPDYTYFVLQTDTLIGHKDARTRVKSPRPCDLVSILPNIDSIPLLIV